MFSAVVFIQRYTKILIGEGYAMPNMCFDVFCDFILVHPSSWDSRPLVREVDLGLGRIAFMWGKVTAQVGILGSHVRTDASYYWGKRPFFYIFVIWKHCFDVAKCPPPFSLIQITRKSLNDAFYYSYCLEYMQDLMIRGISFLHFFSGPLVKLTLRSPLGGESRDEESLLWWFATLFFSKICLGLFV